MASIINAATSGGLVTTADTSGILQLQTAGTTAVTVDAAGGVKTLNTISVGNATPSTSGAGITFPATQSASTDPQTLDDYEEGTWTPTLSSITNWTGTPTTVYAKYIKIGKSVFMEFQFNGTVTTGSTQTYFVMTLPITATSTSVSAGGMDAEGYIGLVRANASTNCYLVIQAATGMTSGNHYPTGTATYSSAN